jgi:hypothetical protein
VHEKARWLSTLLSTDLDTATLPEAQKLLAEYHIFLHGEGFGDSRVGKALGHGALSLEAKIVAWDPRENLKKIQEIIKSFLEKLINFRDGEINQMPFIKTRLIIRKWEEDDSLWLENADAASEEGMLKEEIVRLLSDVSSEAIQLCNNEPCQSPFIHTSKRTKVYCSQRCAWQQTSREKRRTLEEKEKRLKAKRDRYNWKKKGG